MTSRESHRIKDAEKKRVLDEAARRRRARKAIEALEQDNFHDDPHADLVMSKKVPKFQDSSEGPTRAKKAKKKNNEFMRGKYRKNLGQLLEEAKMVTDEPNYFSALAPPPTEPERHFCAVCGNFSNYTCTSCGTRFCCLRCLKTHQDTRCLKWTA